MRAFSVTWVEDERESRPVYIKATSAGRARFICAVVLKEYYGKDIGEALIALRVKRVKELDDMPVFNGRDEGLLDLQGDASCQESLQG